MMLEQRPDGFDLTLGGRTILSHRHAAPCFFVGRGKERMTMYRGNFDIEDRLDSRIPLPNTTIETAADGWSVEFAPFVGAPPLLVLTFAGDAANGTIGVECLDPSLNRFWLRVAAEPGEHVWGGGEQMSYFDMRGRRFPLWTAEPGVGRDKTTLLTFQADVQGRAGGDYHTTNYPQPTYLSSRRYALHVETTAYSVFDFRDDAFHEIEVWAMPERVELFGRSDFLGLVQAMADRFGRQPKLPGWALEGAIVGLKDGLRSFERLETYLAAGAVVSALWCEDWAGVRETSFGKRLFWDWRASEGRYPELKRRVAELEKLGIRFLGYVNPYLCQDGALFPEAEEKNYLATAPGGGTYLVDFGEFDCGVVDFTDPDACQWFEDRILGENMIDLGLSGWMADFGEYLPIDLHLKSGADPKLMHNAWPVLWAAVNARAVEKKGRTGDVVFFMRAGYSGVQAHCPLLWAGDQSVDFTRHDGLATVICGALSSGLLGNAYHHSDIGGYTSLFGNVRTPELLKRWAEMAAFTPVMRTHEGNRPTENLQVDGNADVLAHFGRMTRIHAALKPYLDVLASEAADRGLPLQRPLFLHHEEDARTYTIQDAYLLGRDLLVAPVSAAGRERWTTYLPAGCDWTHLWSGERYRGATEADVAAPFGEPPVFFREDTAFRRVFEALRGI